jgi:hypothetical protein
MVCESVKGIKRIKKGKNIRELDQKENVYKKDVLFLVMKKRKNLYKNFKDLTYGTLKHIVHYLEIGNTGTFSRRNQK